MHENGKVESSSDHICLYIYNIKYMFKFYPIRNGEPWMDLKQNSGMIRFVFLDYSDSSVKDGLDGRDLKQGDQIGSC